MSSQSLRMEVVEQLERLTAPDDRIVMLPGKFAPGRMQEEYPQHCGFKPWGIWYACGLSWIRWLIEHDSALWGKYVYRVNVWDGELLKIRSPDGMERFQRNYEVHPEMLDDDLRRQYRDLKEDLEENAHRRFHPWEMINWKRVAERHPGIEICPALPAENHRTWYRQWGVASGCIWRTEYIENFEEILVLKTGDAR